MVCAMLKYCVMLLSDQTNLLKYSVMLLSDQTTPPPNLMVLQISSVLYYWLLVQWEINSNYLSANAALLDFDIILHMVT
jgi:hypothetical protein